MFNLAAPIALHGTSGNEHSLVDLVGRIDGISVIIYHCLVESLAKNKERTAKQVFRLLEGLPGHDECCYV